MSTHHYWQQNAPDHQQHEEKPTPILVALTALALGFLLMLAIYLIVLM